jgi:hypothetical protein
LIQEEEHNKTKTKQALVLYLLFLLTCNVVYPHKCLVLQFFHQLELQPALDDMKSNMEKVLQGESSVILDVFFFWTETLLKYLKQLQAEKKKLKPVTKYLKDIEVPLLC